MKPLEEIEEELFDRVFKNNCKNLPIKHLPGFTYWAYLSEEDRDILKDALARKYSIVNLTVSLNESENRFRDYARSRILKESISIEI